MEDDEDDYGGEPVPADADENMLLAMMIMAMEIATVRATTSMDDDGGTDDAMRMAMAMMLVMKKKMMMLISMLMLVVVILDVFIFMCRYAHRNYACHTLYRHPYHPSHQHVHPFCYLVSFLPTKKLHARHHIILTIVIIIRTLIIKNPDRNLKGPLQEHRVLSERLEELHSAGRDRTLACREHGASTGDEQCPGEDAQV